MFRREVAELIFNYIKSIKFKPYNIEYGNGYFIFDKGEDGVVHFKIRGLFGWKFAMWINTNKDELIEESGKEDYPALQFFAQHKDNIDKFKPSRSAFLVEYTLRECENPDHYQWWQIKDMLKMIRAHPFISHHNDRTGGYETDGSYILYYIKTKYRDVSYNMKQLYEDWIPITWVRFKLMFCSKQQIVDRIKVVDGNSKDWTSHPRWSVDILFKENSSDELECKYLDKWFNRVHDNISLRIHRVGIDGYYSYE